MNYHAERHALIEYLRVKLVANDWHAVSDAANDLRVLEAQWSAIPKTADKPFQSYFGDSAVDKPESTSRPSDGACDAKPQYDNPNRDPFKEAGWTSNPIKLDKIPQREFRCAYTAGDRCIRPHDHDGDHYFS